MADGYGYQAAGRPGFVNLHTAGDLGDVFGGLLNASESRTPPIRAVDPSGVTVPVPHGQLFYRAITAALNPLERSR
jgi:benzoylformate decarboxylase